jgi:hypothetical protein
MQNKVADPVLQEKLTNMGCGESPTEWDRYRMGVRCSSYSLATYTTDHSDEKNITRKRVGRPGSLRGFPVRPGPSRTAKISDAQEDHNPYPKEGNLSAAPRPIAPIEGLPSPQSAFGMKWDCDTEQLSDKLKALIASLNSDKINGWAFSIGFTRDSRKFERESMRLLWRYLNESPAMREIFQVPTGRDMGFPYLDAFVVQPNGERILESMINTPDFDIDSDDPRVASVVQVLVEAPLHRGPPLHTPRRPGA